VLLAAVIPQSPKGIAMNASDLLYVAIIIVFFASIEIAMALMGKRKTNHGEHA
jgi:hypothetical protein